jgi:uncharacterized protein YndB with AHSA1/START domain
MVKKILLGLLLVIVLVMIFAATRADTFRLERSTTIKAEPAKVYALLNDFHNFSSWSPWQKLDPALQATQSGAPSGQGAVYAWTGNDAVGSGRMEILQAVPNTSVTVKLDFIKPFEAHNTSLYTLTPGTGGTTTVTWAMYGPSPYISKLMGVFVSMDSLIGKDFERGLANLKTVAEK